MVASSIFVMKSLRWQVAAMAWRMRARAASECQKMKMQKQSLESLFLSSLRPVSHSHADCLHGPEVHLGAWWLSRSRMSNVYIP